MVAGLMLALVFAAGLPAEPLARRIPPVDECADDPAFVAFRDELHRAIERKDRDYLLSTLADDILVDFGGGAGREAFIKAWHLEQPEASPVWAELGEVLRLGCARDSEQGNWSPSMFTSGEIDDPFGTALVIHPGATLHAAPDPASPVLATLDWDLVTIVEWDGEDPWQRVRTTAGRAGFVRSVDLRSPVDHRAGFRRIHGRWRMVTFVAGD